MIAEPATDRAMPIQEVAPALSPSSFEESAAAKTGIVVTRTTEEATLVRRRDVIQLAKCIPSRMPAASDDHAAVGFRSHAPRSRGLRPPARGASTANGSRTRAAIARR